MNKYTEQFKHSAQMKSVSKGVTKMYTNKSQQCNSSAYNAIKDIKSG